MNSKYINLITIIIILTIIVSSCSQPDWKKKGFASENAFYKFNKEKYFDSLNNSLPILFLTDSIVGKYRGNYSILSIDKNGIMKQEFPNTIYDTSYPPNYFIIDMKHPELTETTYGEWNARVREIGYKLRIKVKDKFQEEYDYTYEFQYHSNNDNRTNPVIGCIYFLNGTKKSEGEGYIAELSLFEYFKKQGFRIGKDY
jgi:hypothetical protein